MVAEEPLLPATSIGLVDPCMTMLGACSSSREPPEAFWLLALATVGPVTVVFGGTGAYAMATGLVPVDPFQLTASWYGPGTDHDPDCWLASAKPSASSPVDAIVGVTVGVRVIVGVSVIVGVDVGVDVGPPGVTVPVGVDVRTVGVGEVVVIPIAVHVCDSSPPTQ